MTFRMSDEAPGTRHFCGWTRGDHLGLDIPAEPQDLLRGGTRFLTAAFHAGGMLDPDNGVTAITRFDPLAIGGTGSKLLLSVEYAQPQPGLPTELFVKFSRNSADPGRDRLRHHMREEILFALASRAADFPVRVPHCLFADFHEASGTGLLITERILYGEGGIEPCHVKCRDFELGDALDHYRTIVHALAGLAGAGKVDDLPADMARFFPKHGPNIFETYRTPSDLGTLVAKVDRIEAFAGRHPHLVYASPALFDRIRTDLAVVLAQDQAIRQSMLGNDDYISLCHFNANIDNAWFWQDEAGKRQCGFIDWGMVGRMHVAQALWGSLSGAEGDIWSDCLDELILLFINRYHACGGPLLEPSKLRRDLQLFGIYLGMIALFDAPHRVLQEIPDLAPDATRFDPAFAVHENARVHLHILNNVLRIWERFDVAQCLAVA